LLIIWTCDRLAWPLGSPYNWDWQDTVPPSMFLQVRWPFGYTIVSRTVTRCRSPWNEHSYATAHAAYRHGLHHWFCWSRPYRARHFLAFAPSVHDNDTTWNIVHHIQNTITVCSKAKAITKISVWLVGMKPEAQQIIAICYLSLTTEKKLQRLHSSLVGGWLFQI